MALLKTEPGRIALQTRDRALTPRDRQILVIANGEHSRGEMVALLGHDAGAQIDRLLSMGFLQSREGASAAHAAQSPEAPEGSASNEVRRSLVASKVYCVDRLQLVRHPQAAVLVRAIQESASEADLMEQVFACVRFMHENTAISYAAKVTARLAEIVPRSYLGKLLAEWPLERAATAH